MSVLSHGQSPRIIHLSHLMTPLDSQIDTALPQSQPRSWYAMRATYRRELLAKQLLDAASLENYVAMRHVVKQTRGRKVRVQVPAVSSLIFVHAGRDELQQFKSHHPFLQYYTSLRGNKNEPIIVPDSEMAHFITATSTLDEDLMFIHPHELNLTKGTKVRIHGGTFDGMEGIFVKVQGKRNRRVVITIQNVISVALAYVNPDYIEVL